MTLPLTKLTAKQLQDRAVALLREAFPDYAIDPHGGSIGSAEAVLRFKFTARTDEDPIALERRKFAEVAPLVGLTADDYGRTFTGQDGTRYALVALAPSRPRFPLTGRRLSDGKRYKFSLDILKVLRNRAPVGSLTEEAAP